MKNVIEAISCCFVLFALFFNKIHSQTCDNSNNIGEYFVDNNWGKSETIPSNEKNLKTEAKCVETVETNMGKKNDKALITLLPLESHWVGVNKVIFIETAGTYSYIAKYITWHIKGMVTLI